MTTPHSQIALDLRDRAAREFASPHQVDQMVASELLWGSVAQAIIAVAIEKGWPRDSHGAFRNAVRALATQHDDPRLVTFFDSAEKLHENFYHDNLKAGEVARRREQAERLIPRLLAFLG